MLSSGSTCAEGGHRQSIRHENTSESGDVKARSGAHFPLELAMPVLTLLFVACPYTRRARSPGRVDISMGCTTFLLVPRSSLPIPYYGVPSRR